MNDFDDDLILDYLAESREHLSTIEADLLVMEQAGAAIDEQVVNRVFRAAHSIKGGAGFFSLDRIRELAHRAESVLDLIRCRELVPNAEIVSILLLAFDKLRDLLQDHQNSNSTDISDFVSALSHLAVASLPTDKKDLLEEQVALASPQAGKLIQISAFDLSQARRDGRSIYLIELDLVHDVERRGTTPLAVLRRLMQSGTLVSTCFDLDSAGTLDDEPSNQLILEALYSSRLHGDQIRDFLQIPIDRIHLIEENASTPTVAASMTSLAVAVSERNPPARTPAISVPLPDATVATTARNPPTTEPPPTETTIRVNVDLLDSLMTLAGELVLSRNQLSEAVSSHDEQAIRAGANRLNLVTSELQAAVALTRMQPVGTLFAKFPRLVRDLSRDLGKQVQLLIEGSEVEMDRTILEGLSDPLTHMIRNSVDHGIESPEVRVAEGKPAQGTVTLRAAHQAGQVVIEIVDDGKGLRPDKIASSTLARGMVTREQLDTMSDRDKMALIFLPGVSTAETVSSVSGRGVGMDVVKTNLDKLGGKVEIDSVPGRGTTFAIKLPLTLAIIPSLLVSDHGQRFAIPQVSVGELIRLPARDLADRIDRAADGAVLLLRDRLVPLVDLQEALGAGPRSTSDRALNVILVNAAGVEFGLVVEELHDTVEIVVKPLGRHLQHLADYAGATVLGDGQVALILDVAGLASRAGIATAARSHPAGRDEASTRDLHSLLLFHNASHETCAVPIELVTRVERIRPTQVQHLGGRRTMQYGNASLPLVSLSDVASVSPLVESQSWVVIVFERAGRPLGLLAAEPLEMIEADVELDPITLRQPGIAGSATLNGQTTLMVDIFELGQASRRGALPDAVARPLDEHIPAPYARGTNVLVAEDSDFFRGQICRILEAAGYQVVAAGDGEAAWEWLHRHATEVDIVVTDVEMPGLDGLGLTRRLRADGRFDAVPVIALSSLAGEQEIARAMAAGVTEYQVKLDQEQLLNGVRRATGQPLLSELVR